MVQGQQPGHDAPEAPTDDVDRATVLFDELIETPEQLAHGLVVGTDVQTKAPRGRTMPERTQCESERCRRHVTGSETGEHQDAPSDTAGRRCQPGRRQHEHPELRDGEQLGNCWRWSFHVTRL